MASKHETSDDVTSLSDLDENQREDLEAMCDDGLMPAQIAKRLGIPTRVAADGRRSWKRRKELDEQKVAPPVAPVTPTTGVLADLMAMTQQQLQQTLIQAQIDTMVETLRHKKVSNQLEERERRLELEEREAKFREEFAPEPEKSTDTTLDAYNFEDDPLGAFVRLGKEIKNMNAPNAIGSPQSHDVPQTAKDLSDDEIAAYVAKQPAPVIGKALAAVDTPYQGELERVLAANGVTPNNVPRVLEWLRKEKKRRAKGKA